VFGWGGLGVISFFGFLSLFVVVYLSICFQFNRKLPFEKYRAALFCRR
jgi:ABC-type multidrug transport system permease subunit